MAMSRSPSRIAMTLALLLATLWWATGPVQQAHAATDVVTDCQDSITDLPGGNFTVDPGTLRYVVEHAAAGDTITFACSGTMTLAGPGVISLFKNLTIDGSAQKVTLDGGGACGLGILEVTNNASVDLR